MSCISHLNLCPSSGDTENVLLQKILQSVNAGGGVAGVSSISVNGGAPQTGAVAISTGGTVTSVNGDPGPAVSLDSGEIPEGSNQYFTVVRVRATDLTGLVATAGVVAATDTILQAFGKVAGTTNNLLNFRDSGVGGHADASIFINSGATEIVTVQGADSFIRLASERLQRNITSGKLALLGGTSKGTGAFVEAHGDTSASVGLVSITTKGRITGTTGFFQIFNNDIGSAAGDLRAQMGWEGSWTFSPVWNDGAVTFTGIKLNLTDTASAAASLLLDLQVSATSRFNVAKTGALRISGSSAATSLIHASTNTTATGLAIFEQASADADPFDLSFRKTRGTVASPTVITTGDSLGQILFRGYSGAAGYVTAATIRADSTGTIATTRVASSLIFSTGTDAAPTVLTDRVTINNVGNVGVGAAPLRRFHVTDISRDYASFPTMLITTGTGISTDESLYIGVHDGDYSWIQPIKPGTAYRNLLLCPNAGNVGIGGLPQEQLSLGAASSGLGVYELLTDASNYSRTKITTTAGNHLIRTEAVGTGTLRILQVGTGPSVGTNIAGINSIYHAGQSTGTGLSGSILLQTSPAGSTGAAVNALVTRVTISSTDITHATAVRLAVASGTNQRAGNATLVGGTVTVSNTTVTANTIVMLTRKTSGGTIGTAITYTVSAATSFTINSDNILDTSVFSYFLIEVP